MPDARKGLDVLQAEWLECQECRLGVARVERDGAFVFGEGATNKILLVGEGPGAAEEDKGVPFVGESGEFLRNVLERLDLLDQCYMTNSVCCRSWDYMYDPQGQVRVDWKTNEPRVKDEAPKPAEVAACRPRLLEQIYLVDPVLIVALGGTAAEALLKKSITITASSGVLHHMKVPGAGYRAALTPKGKWARKVRGGVVMPSIQNEVVYPVVPLLHPAYAMANASDQRRGAPMQMFVEGLETIKSIYETYKREVRESARG